MDQYYIPGFTDALTSSVSPTAMAAGQTGATSPQALQAMLAQLDQLQRGRYDRPTAGVAPGALGTLNGMSGIQFVTNAGRGADVKANRSGFVPYIEGAEYRLTNQRKKQAGVVTSGTGEQGLLSVYDAARNLSTSQGKNAKWVVEVRDPTTGQWTAVAQDRPKSDPVKIAGKVLGTALPLAVSLIPGMQFAGPVLSSVLAGGAGAALAGRDPLKGAVMGGLSSAGGQILGPAIQGAPNAAGKVVATNLGRAVGTGVGSFAGGVATGQNLKDAAIGGLTAGGASFIGGELFGPGDPLTPDGLAADFDATFPSGGGGLSYGGGNGIVGPDGITVTGVPRPAAFGPNIGGGFNSFQPTDASGAQRLQDIQQKDDVVDGVDQTTREIVAVGAPEVPAPAEPNLGVFTPNVVDGVDQTTREIVAVGAPEVPAPAEPNLGVITPDIQKIIDDVSKNLTEEQKKGLTTADYIRLASLAVGVGGDLFGGGGGGSKVPGGLGGGANLGSVFNKPLPAPNMPGLTAGTGGPRAPTDLAAGGLRSPQDYYRYGYGPEQSFFQHVPQGAPNTSQAFTGYAKGGFAVGGAGDGRDDKIPALLSDGEYVVDAETVAMLGNGSNKAGAEMLDKFRVNVRKHKGRKLASGKFSDNAKKPEQYLAKGRKHG